MDKNQERPGMYVPELEKDSCGTGLIAQLNGHKSHKLVEDALTLLSNMEHRGACGCEPNTGDGAGIMTQNPHDYFINECADLGFELPGFGKYGVGFLFLPKNPSLKEKCRRILNKACSEIGFEVLGYRDVPTNPTGLGPSALAVEPAMEQIFLQPSSEIERKELERKLYILRKFAIHKIHDTYPEVEDAFYICSLSYKTIIYKGQLTTFQLGSYYPDLHNPNYKSAIAIIHSRFSTNTIPKWKLAQPFRYIAHNGEINTIKGNLNWWRSREKDLAPHTFTKEEKEQITPICYKNLSDSGSFDNVLEYLIMSGKSFPHALMTMIPEAWQDNQFMADHKKSFYEYHETMMEPWDGPASICFSDGIVVGATLDRNGLRPARYSLLKDNTLVVASEAGALPLDPASVKFKGRLQPGKMLIADLDENRIIGDEELKDIVCKRQPYREWLNAGKLNLENLPVKSLTINDYDLDLLSRQKLFGLNKDDLKHYLKPMLEKGGDPISSMGNDTPLAILSHKPQHIANYFKQLFAQVTNPPIDPIRERSVMSLYSHLGKAGNISFLDKEQCRQIHLAHPVLDAVDVAKIKGIETDSGFNVGHIDITYAANDDSGLEDSINRLQAEAVALVEANHNILLLSDKNSGKDRIPIPALMAAGSVHHSLIEHSLRNNTSILVETGDARESHHFATLIGYGADAIFPYLTFETIESLYHSGELDDTKSLDEYIAIYKKSIGKSLLKIISKIGISTIKSYKGAQTFEALGINKSVIDQCFKGTISRIGGIGFGGLQKEALLRHNQAMNVHIGIESIGQYQWKVGGEYHLFNPTTIHLLQYSTRKNDFDIFKKYTKAINDQMIQACTLRGLIDFKERDSIPIDEVEPIEKILKRFATGAMSFGSISHEAHSTLAIAMNRIGGKSNSGEGGEDDIRFIKKANGDWERSAIKQVASGRFGVTSYYLTNADELQIKMAQGAKPGEGGQLPGHKVDDWIARVRNSTPGVGLISPPPHHDIYSIEDLAQLIFDLKNANREARINVKLVSKAGVGVIASGVAKAHADVILISGHDGGTGASPVTSIRHAGLPWELGIAEAQQTLVRNKLRDRVVLQTDGQIRTGRDLAIATLLGAEEWGIATAALIVEGCIMMRKCHLNTCPVGIATQDPILRERFTGDADHVVNFFKFLAEDLREIMASLGFRTVNEMVGRSDILKKRDGLTHWKYEHINLEPLFYKNPKFKDVGQFKRVKQDHGIDKVLDWKLLKRSKLALEGLASISSERKIKNTDRAVGTILSNEISKIYGKAGLPEDTIEFRFRGSAGQSFGAFAAKGIKFILEGEANDYFGKGLSGGKLIVSHDRKATFDPGENIIIGNVAFYGATSGEAYIKGMAGERFCVRNSGVKAVVEGVGDHCCEYMTGGVVIVLGKTGSNFAAGMSGGIAYVLNESNDFLNRCNQDSVELEQLDDDDRLELRKLIRAHCWHTSSKRGFEILNNWSKYIQSFIKVMPIEYKKALLRNMAARKKSMVKTS